MADICLGCGETLDGRYTDHGNGEYSLCGRCYADGCDMWKGEGGAYVFLRSDGDTERAKQRLESIQKHPNLNSQRENSDE